MLSGEAMEEAPAAGATAAAISHIIIEGTLLTAFQALSLKIALEHVLARLDATEPSAPGAPDMRMVRHHRAQLRSVLALIAGGDAKPVPPATGSR